MIQIPIEIGDIILAGRFKNKKIKVNELGTDDYGNPTVNGRSILKIRIPKLYQQQENNMNEQMNPNSLEKGMEYSYFNGNDWDTVIYKGRASDQVHHIFKSQKHSLTLTRNNVIRHIKPLNENKEMKTSIKENFKFSQEIASRTGLRQSAVETFLLNNNIDEFQLLQAIGQKKIKPMDVSTAISGNPNNKFAQELVKKFALKESMKNKLDNLILKVLRENDETFAPGREGINVKVKEVDGRWRICQEDTDEYRDNIGYETKELAQHAAMTKGFNVKGGEDESPIAEPLDATKREKTKGVDKVEDVKLDKEKEIKLEILRIAKRVIKEELKKKPEDEIQKVLEFIKFQIGLN